MNFVVHLIDGKVISFPELPEKDEIDRLLKNPNGIIMGDSIIIPVRAITHVEWK